MVVRSVFTFCWLVLSLLRIYILYMYMYNGHSICYFIFFGMHLCQKRKCVTVCVANELADVRRG